MHFSVSLVLIFFIMFQCGTAVCSLHRPTSSDPLHFTSYYTFCKVLNGFISTVGISDKLVFAGMIDEVLSLKLEQQHALQQQQLSPTGNITAALGSGGGSGASTSGGFGFPSRASSIGSVHVSYSSASSTHNTGYLLAYTVNHFIFTDANFCCSIVLAIFIAANFSIPNTKRAPFSICTTHMQN